MSKKQFDISIDHPMMIAAKAAFDTCMRMAVGKAIGTGSDEGSATLRITARTAKEQPKYKKTAAALLKRCREFYQDPENERAYQEWKEKKNDTSQLIQRNRRTGSGGGDGGVYNRRAV